MSQQTEIEFISEGFEKILTSNGARQACENAGASIQARANSMLNEESSGFKMSSRTVWAYGSRRNMTFVHTTDYASMVAQAEEHVLVKAVK